MDVCVLRCTQDAYLDIWVGRVIIIKCQDNDLLCYSTNLVISLVSPQLLSSDFTSDFWFMSITILHLLTSCFTTRVLFHQSPAVIILYYTCSRLDIDYCLFTCSCIPVLTTRFLTHVNDLNLSIHECLSMHAI